MRHAIIERIRHVLLPNIKRYLTAKPELIRFPFLFPRLPSDDQRYAVGCNVVLGCTENRRHICVHDHWLPTEKTEVH